MHFLKLFTFFLSFFCLCIFPSKHWTQSHTISNWQHYSIKCAATCIHSVRTRHYRYISSVYVPDAPGTRWCEHVSLHIMNTTAYVRPCSLRLVVLYSCLKRYLQREATSFQTTLRWHSTSVVARTSLFTLPLACACIHARACVEQVRFWTK